MTKQQQQRFTLQFGVVNEIDILQEQSLSVLPRRSIRHFGHVR